MWGGSCWVIRAGNYLVSLHPLDSGKPPKALRPSPPPFRPLSRAPSTIQSPLLAFQSPGPPPPSRLSLQPSGSPPPPSRVPILCGLPHSSRDPVCSLAWALPHPGFLSTICFPPTSGGPLHPPGPPFLSAPSTLQAEPSVLWGPTLPSGAPSVLQGHLQGYPLPV